jgi:hypothetical protein
LETQRQNREEEARRRAELAEHTRQGRQQARRATQEADSSAPEYGIVLYPRPGCSAKRLTATRAGYGVGRRKTVLLRADRPSSQLIVTWSPRR